MKNFRNCRIQNHGFCDNLVFFCVISVQQGLPKPIVCGVEYAAQARDFNA